MPVFAINFSRPGTPGDRAVLQLRPPRAGRLPPHPAERPGRRGPPRRRDREDGPVPHAHARHRPPGAVVDDEGRRQLHRLRALGGAARRTAGRSRRTRCPPNLTDLAHLPHRGAPRAEHGPRRTSSWTTCARWWTASPPRRPTARPTPPPGPASATRSPRRCSSAGSTGGSACSSRSGRRGSRSARSRTSPRAPTRPPSGSPSSSDRSSSPAPRACSSSRRCREGGWLDRLATAVQFVGTLFFNWTTLAGLNDALDTQEQIHRVWAPDAVGSICFLVASYVAIVALCGQPVVPAPRRHPLAHRDAEHGRLGLLRHLGDHVVHPPRHRRGAERRRDQRDDLPRGGLLPGGRRCC